MVQHASTVLWPAGSMPNHDCPLTAWPGQGMSNASLPVFSLCEESVLVCSTSCEVLRKCSC